MAKLLLVEDEAKIADLLEKRLLKDGFVPELARDGVSAIKLLQSEVYDLVILDIMLPGADGIAVLKVIRQQNKKLPVIALTARGELADVVSGLDIGFDDYLAKPFAYSELAARLRALLRRVGNGDVVLGALDLTLDPGRLEVKRAGQLIQLTSKEYQILEYLLRHKGAYISVSELLEKVWDRNYDGLSNTVVVHIRNLKKKLVGNSPKAAPIIYSERGKGYIIHD